MGSPGGSPSSFAHARPRDHAWLRAAVWALDTRLRLRYGVREYTRRAECMFRIQVSRAAAELRLCDGTRLHGGDRILELHLWNEQIPRMAGRGPTLRWAVQINRSIELSLQELAIHLRRRRDLCDIVAVRANIGAGSLEERRRFARFMGRFGFETKPTQAPASLAMRLHRLGENVLVAAMVLARNPAAFRPSLLWRGRIEMYLSRRSLEERYRPPPRSPATLPPRPGRPQP